MIKYLPFLLMIGYALLMYQFSARRTARELNANSTVLADPGLKVLTDKMARALDLRRIKVHIYEVEPVNGLAAPDGRIFLTRGFLRKYHAGEVTADELASVIAHELGHVALGHSRRRMIDFSGQNAIRMALATVLNRFLPGIGALVANGLVSMLSAGLSRSDEYEADAYAAALLTKADIGTGAQKSLFSKLDTITGHGGAPPVWLASHPKSQDRIRAIEEMEARWLRQK